MQFSDNKLNAHNCTPKADDSETNKSKISATDCNQKHTQFHAMVKNTTYGVEHNQTQFSDLSRPASSSSEFQWWSRLVSEWSTVWSSWNKVQAQLVCWLTSHCSLQSSDSDSESSWRLSQRWTETLHQATWLTQSEYEKITRVFDVLVDFQTGGNFPVLVRYIYKFVN